MNKWGLLDEIQYRKLRRKVYEKPGKELKQFFAIRPNVVKVFEADGIEIISKATKGPLWVYKIW